MAPKLSWRLSVWEGVKAVGIFEFHNQVSVTVNFFLNTWWSSHCKTQFLFPKYRKDHHVISTYRLSYNGLIYLLRKMDKLCHLSLCRIRPTKNCLRYEPCTSTEVSLEVQIEEGKVWPYPQQSSSHPAWSQNCTDFVIAQTLTISLKCKTHVKCVLLTLLILSSWSSSKRTCTQARIVATSRHPPCGGDWRATWTSDWRSIWGKTNNKKKVR